MSDSLLMQFVRSVVDLVYALLNFSNDMSYTDLMLTGIFLLLLYPRLILVRQKVNKVWRELPIVRKYYEIR